MGCCGGGSGLGRQRALNRDMEPDVAAGGDTNPETALKLRLARGEITVEGYRELLDVLRAPEAGQAASR